MVALADGPGRPAIQYYSYTPYGTIQSADLFQSSTYPLSVNSLGHQGLFFDNLATPWAKGLSVYRPQDARSMVPLDPDDPKSELVEHIDRHVAPKSVVLLAGPTWSTKARTNLRSVSSCHRCPPWDIGVPFAAGCTGARWHRDLPTVALR